MDQELIAGRYRLLDRHATGGMATVWRARDEWTREFVAVKRLHPYLLADPTARARLEREAETLRSIFHPAIVHPRALVDDPDGPCLIMDFVAGQPLDERIATGPLPPGEAAAIAGVLADALAVAHDRGIVHRDIKPGNVLVDDDGAVHLVDFGIAALAGAPEDLTAESTMVGTLRYAAPERLAGEDVTAQTDVWALGAVLYEMLSGSPAISNTDPAGALAASLAAPPPLDDLPPALASVVARAMSPSPAVRYPDAAALRDAILAAGAPVDADAVTTVVSLPPPEPVAVASGAGASTRPAPRSIFLALAATAAAVALLVALVGPMIPAGVAGPLDAAHGSAAPTSPVVVSPGPASTPTRVDVADDKGSSNGKGKGDGKGKGRGGD